MVHYSVTANNKVVRSGKVSLDIEPQDSKEFTVPVGNLKPQAGTEYFVNFNVTTVEKEPLIPIGHEIACDQFRLPIESPKKAFKISGPKLTVSTNGDNLSASSSKVNFMFNKKTGIVTSYKVDGTEYFSEVLVSNRTSGVRRPITITEMVCQNAYKYGRKAARTST